MDAQCAWRRGVPHPPETTKPNSTPSKNAACTDLRPNPTAKPNLARFVGRPPSGLCSAFCRDPPKPAPCTYTTHPFAHHSKICAGSANRLGPRHCGYAQLHMGLSSPSSPSLALSRLKTPICFPSNGCRCPSPLLLPPMHGASWCPCRVRMCMMPSSHLFELH